MRFDGLSDYELAAAFATVCRERPRNQMEHDERQRTIDELGAAMDRRDVRLEDWDTTAR